jgi:protein CpxP
MKSRAIVLCLGALLAGLMLPGQASAQDPAAAAPDPDGAMGAPVAAPESVTHPGPSFYRRSSMDRRGFGAWWKNSETVKAIGLSDDQAKQIASKFLEHRMKLADLHADLEKQELQLQPLVDADQPDAARVGAQIDQVVAARGRLEKELTMMDLDIRRVLTVDQWKKLKEVQQERMKSFWHEAPRDGRGFRGDRPPHRHPAPPAPPAPPNSEQD